MAKFIRKLITTILIIHTTFIVSADDIDILQSESKLGANILFVMDLSGSMNWSLTDEESPPSGQPTRLEELTGAFNSIIDNEAFDDLNIGLSVFSGDGQSGAGKGKAHGIMYPVKPLTGTTAQSILDSNLSFTHPGSSYMPAATTMESREYLGLLTADSSIWSAGGSTPIADALYEAAQYFRADEMYWGDFTPDDIRGAHPSTYNGDISTGKFFEPTLSCDVGDRQTCTCGGNCGISQIATTGPGTVNSSTDTGGCTLNPAGTTTCSSATIPCGSETNCTTHITTNTVYCGKDVKLEECELNNPTYYSCEKIKISVPTYNDEGEVKYEDEDRIECSQDISEKTCDAEATYSCPTTVTSCTKCPDTEVTGEIKYVSPITESCVKNAIILLTDGEPTENNTRGKSRLEDLVGSSSCAKNDYDGDGDDDFDNDGRCGPEIAAFMANTDHADGTVNTIPELDNLPNPNVVGDTGIQNVITNTVGLALTSGSQAIPYLQDIADKGKGVFVNTANQAELTAAFENLINNVVGKPRSFAAPTYSVDTTNLLSHGNHVYIPLFDRDGVVWPGNLKKYKMVDGVLLGQDDVPATDDYGNLLAGALDIWAKPGATGDLISGGAANKIYPTATTIRNVKTDNVTSPATTGSLVTLNTSIVNSAFGLDDSSATDTALKSDLVKYIKGINPADDSIRHHMGDIIHSKPVKLNIAGEDSLIFVGTNEGYLHAINDADGTEAYAYMPRELLVNIKTQYAKTVTPKHIYGVDGPLTLWIDESANTNANEVGNGILDAGSNEKAYLFFGLRRGGNYYYALDVTSPTTPVLKWKKVISNGNSWSQPVLTHIKTDTNTKPEPYIIIGGGYTDYAEDPDKPEIITEMPDTGNAVYVVNAKTGVSEWNTKVAFDNSKVTNFSGDTMPNAIPSRIRVVDVDRNGSADKLYFGDTGGNIWRVDLNASYMNTDTTDDGKLSEAKLHLFAELGGDKRKFFEEPDVAIFRKSGKTVAAIAIGSGNRPTPLSVDAKDLFFVTYDREVIGLPTMKKIKKGDLEDADGLSASDEAKSDFKGWYKKLSDSYGEKVLSTAIIYQNKVMFTTFASTSTTSIDPNSCGAQEANESQLYIMDLLTANVNYKEVAATGEILGTPQIIFGELINEDGTASCEVDKDTNCERQTVVRVGKVGPIAIQPPVAGAIIPDVLPRVYWLDNEIKK